MIATIPSAVLIGVDGKQVSVEVHVSNGLPGFTVVGLPDAAVRESRDRVRAAFLSSGLQWPLRRITVNLALSGVRKGGSGLDLPIAVGVLVASGTLSPDEVRGMAFVGELGLDGSIRGVPGTLVLGEALKDFDLVVAEANAMEAILSAPRKVRTAEDLGLLVGRLLGDDPWIPISGTRALPDLPGPDDLVGEGPDPDVSDVLGQPFARRAIEVAAAGGHHLLMVGPPGSGKTLLANCLPGLLPPLSHATSLEVTRVHSVAGTPIPRSGLIQRPPFRAPHHGASPVSMVGGGTTWMRPGEISLAHGGVLFLDEMGEFPTAVLDALRQPLEDGQIRVSRARGSAVLPARFTLVGAMNPCPCGEGGIPGSCRCTDSARERYARRLSAPLLDRFDIAIRVDRPDATALFPGRDRSESGGAPCSPTSSEVAERVERARRLATERGVEVNARLSGRDLESRAPMSSSACALLEREVRSGSLSARGLHRVHRLALTCADLDGHTGTIELVHVHEALILRGHRDLLLGGGPR